TGAANTDATMLIATNTALAAGAGTLLGMIYSWIRKGKPDLGYTLNGMLAGLVAITANCDSVTNVEAIIIGIVGGILVGLGIDMLEAFKIDDTVGAWPVHGLVGIWGGLATGIFGGHPMGAQIIGSLVIPLWAFVTSYILFTILKAVNLLRVSPEEEQAGLDLSEHGMGAYDLPGLASSGD
ncbi:MAG: ammonium transporter, partial [Caldilineaceae bacterium]|nr:ammonium transporter [Caldilineaceae bacterium]